MTYTESAALMTDMAFRGRVKVGCLTYATSIMNEATATPAHNTRLRWAASCMQNPDNTAMQIQGPVVMDPAVQEAGAMVTDQALQRAVEVTIDKMMV